MQKGWWRAWSRLVVFAAGSWLVVARALAAVLSSFPDRWRLTGAHVSRWARLGRWGLGIRVEVRGSMPPPGSLVVANHQGYADVVALGGLFPCVFAARHDMRSWPLFGALAACGATIFINRDRKRAGVRGIAQVTAALSARATVVVFPEGTSSDGHGLLPLRTGIFQAAVAADAPVVAAAIRYVELDGEPVTEETRSVVGWFRNEPFFSHLVALASHREAVAEIRFGEPLLPPFVDRRELARRVDETLRELLGIVPTLQD